ncbi:helix-turn-helix transcriptional regulator [Paenibacillus lautus]|uniref:helix-turn-helix domain-containing protein n=1 Tax=Paenibacillus lautus TaxID=1401 RepID=UPI002DB6454E|nr:helix-turn-helix transcriptional regulator [Paenibacillus lautus]MEC0310140.1 helix-turn-helix transcriptional regulator [Paenibacillus lautus]
MRLDRLKSHRLEKKLTHEDMASKLGITRQGYGNYESGKRDLDTSTLSLIADILDVDTDYLLGRTNIPKGYETNLSFYGGPEQYTQDEIEEMEAALKRYREMKKRASEQANKKKMN